MKIARVLSLALCVVLLLLGCGVINTQTDNAPDKQAELAEKPSNDITKNYFSNVGNIQNGGYIIKHNGYYYYANQDDYDHLYIKSTDGKDNKMLAGDHCYYNMNLYNNYIYYTSGEPGAIWKISIDGLTKKCLINARAGNLIIYKDHIYYRLSEDDDWGKLYKTDLNGKNKQLLAQKVKSFCIEDDIIYYMDIYKNNALCSMTISGENYKVINTSDVNNIFVQNNMLVYADNNRDDKLYTFDLESKVETCINEDACLNITCNSGWIFYRNQSDGGRLYCVNFDGTKKQMLADSNIAHIVVLGNDIFYRNIDNDNKIEYLPLRFVD